MSLDFSVLTALLAEIFPTWSFSSCWFDLVVLELIFCFVGVNVFNVAKMLKAKVRKMSNEQNNRYVTIAGQESL